MISRAERQTRSIFGFNVEMWVSPQRQFDHLVEIGLVIRIACVNYLTQVVHKRTACIKHIQSLIVHPVVMTCAVQSADNTVSPGKLEVNSLMNTDT